MEKSRSERRLGLCKQLDDAGIEDKAQDEESNRKKNKNTVSWEEE